MSADELDLPPADRRADAPAATSADVVDWARTGRRLRMSLSVIAVVVVLGWLAIGLAGGGLRAGLLAELAGLGVLVSLAAEVVIVGGAAARGMLRAGERGDRLSSGDVSLLPPQLRRRR